jgi:hypothetical protein
MEEPLEDTGPTSGREMQQGSTRLPLHHGCREASPVPAEEDAQSEAQSGSSGSRENEKRRAEGLGAEVEEPLFLSTPTLMASAEEE